MVEVVIERESGGGEVSSIVPGRTAVCGLHCTVLERHCTALHCPHYSSECSRVDQCTLYSSQYNSTDWGGKHCSAVHCSSQCTASNVFPALAPVYSTPSGGDCTLYKMANDDTTAGRLWSPAFNAGKRDCQRYSGYQSTESRWVKIPLTDY